MRSRESCILAYRQILRLGNVSRIARDLSRSGAFILAIKKNPLAAGWIVSPPIPCLDACY